jgi:hypothetical protein
MIFHSYVSLPEGNVDPPWCSLRPLLEKDLSSGLIVILQAIPIQLPLVEASTGVSTCVSHLAVYKNHLQIKKACAYRTIYIKSALLQPLFLPTPQHCVK